MDKWTERWGASVILMCLVLMTVSFSVSVLLMPKELRNGVDEKVTDMIVRLRAVEDRLANYETVVEVTKINKDRVDLLSDLMEFSHDNKNY